MRVKNADFTAKFEEWYIKNPNECYGEMSYINYEADVRTAWMKYRRLYNSGHRVFMNVFSLLAGIAVLVMNTILYIASLKSFDVYYSVSTFVGITVVGIVIMLMPLWDAAVGRYRAERHINDALAAGFAGVVCGCRFYNDRVEFISCREHVIYHIEDIEYIYECADGLYFMIYGGGLRYIPARFFDSEFARLVTERLSVTGFDIYRRRQYMAVMPEAEQAGSFSPPEVEQCEPVMELNYIIDRRAAMRLTGCGRLRPIELIHLTAAAILGICIGYMILFRDIGTLLNRGILILDVIYILICLLLHFSGINLECDRYAGKYAARFFEGHMSVIDESSVQKIDYRNIRSVQCKKECCILNTDWADGRRSIVIPYYALTDVDEFLGFMRAVGLIKQ